MKQKQKTDFKGLRSKNADIIFVFEISCNILILLYCSQNLQLERRMEEDQTKSKMDFKV